MRFDCCCLSFLHFGQHLIVGGKKRSCKVNMCQWKSDTAEPGQLSPDAENISFMTHMQSINEPVRVDDRYMSNGLPSSLPPFTVNQARICAKLLEAEEHKAW